MIFPPLGVFRQYNVSPKPETLSKSEGLGPQNLKHSPNLNVEVHKTLNFY